MTRIEENQHEIQEGTQCIKCKNEWALKISIALLYVLCTLLTIAVSVLIYKVVQQVDSNSEGITNYGGNITAVETALKKLDDQAGEKSENTIQAFKNNITFLQHSVDDTSQAIQKIRNDFQSLEQTARQMRSDAESLRSKVENLQVVASNASALAKSNNDSLEEVGSQLASMASELQNTNSLADAHDQTLREIVDRQREFDRLEVRLDESKQSIDRVTGNISFTMQLNDLHTFSETVGRHSDFLLNLNNSMTGMVTDTASLRSQQEELAARLDKEVTKLSFVMEEMKLVNTKLSQLITNFTILKGPPGPSGPKGDEESQGPPDQPGQKGEEGETGTPGTQEPTVEQGITGPPGLPGLKGCPVEWVNYRDKCYFFSKDKHSFDDSKATCESMSASLLIINDEEEQKWLEKQSFKMYWIGLTDKEEEAVWRWVDGTEPAVTKWRSGQPDNWGHKHGEDCAILHPEGLLDDVFCGNLFPYICEKKLEPSRSPETQRCLEREAAASS